MSILRADSIRDRAGTGAPNFPNGATVTGVVTATSFVGSLTGNVIGNVSGNITGNVTGNADTATSATTASSATSATTATVATNAQGLTGTPNIVVGSITGTSASFSGNVSIGGTLTYEDVNNVDSVGLVTARNGIKVTSGGASFIGPLTERAVISATAINADNICNIDSGLVHYRTANLGGTSNTVDVTSNVGVNTIMSTGDTMSLTVIHAVNSSSSYINNLTIDGLAATETWIGGSAPSDGGTSGVDIYAFTIIKTASDTYTVIGNQTKTS